MRSGDFISFTHARGVLRGTHNQCQRIVRLIGMVHQVREPEARGHQQILRHRHILHAGQRWCPRELALSEGTRDRVECVSTASADYPIQVKVTLRRIQLSLTLPGVARRHPLSNPLRGSQSQFSQPNRARLMSSCSSGSSMRLWRRSRYS